jgi:hypothetical protein
MLFATQKSRFVAGIQNDWSVGGFAHSWIFGQYDSQSLQFFSFSLDLALSSDSAKRQKKTGGMRSLAVCSVQAASPNR